MDDQQLRASNQYLACLVVAVGSHAGAYSDDYAVLLSRASEPHISAEAAREMLLTHWPASGSIAFPLPDVNVTEKEFRGRLLPLVASTSALVSSRGDWANETVLAYEWYVATYWELREAIIEIEAEAIPDTTHIQRQVEERARAEGREADFSEVLIAIAEDLQAKRV